MWHRTLIMAGALVVGMSTACGSNATRATIEPAGDDEIGVSDTPTAVASDELDCDGQTVIVCDNAGRAAAGQVISAEPLDTLTCRVHRVGEGDVELVVSERPAGSTSQPEDRGDGTWEFFVDIAGEYRLRAEASGGGAVCQKAAVAVDARPTSAIHVQLVWHNPSDPDETDTCLSCGADVDLHVTRGDAAWFDTDGDCHYRNPNPDWGTPGRTHDPTLDIDDVNGAGPENINLRSPEDTTYRVGVHYYDTHGFMTTYATVRIYLRGELVWEGVERPMADREFWDVAVIHWPSGQIDTIDRVGVIGAQD